MFKTQIKKEYNGSVTKSIFEWIQIIKEAKKKKQEWVLLEGLEFNTKSTRNEMEDRWLMTKGAYIKNENGKSIKANRHNSGVTCAGKKPLISDEQHKLMRKI
jgi:hypothetical protein